MENKLSEIFGDEVATILGKLAECMDKGEMSAEEIAELIKDMSHEEQHGLHIYATIQKKNELATRILHAIEILKQRKIKDFKDAVAGNAEKEFLSTMSWIVKSDLTVWMGIAEKQCLHIPLTEEEQKYSDILESSITEDLEKEAKKRGFNSLTEWQKYNEKQSINNLSSESYDGLNLR